MVVNELVNAVSYAYPAANIYPGMQAKAMMFVERFSYCIFLNYVWVSYILCKRDFQSQTLLPHCAERIADMAYTAGVFPQAPRPEERDSACIAGVIPLHVVVLFVV